MLKDVVAVAFFLAFLLVSCVASAADLVDVPSGFPGRDMPGRGMMLMAPGGIADPYEPSSMYPVSEKMTVMGRVHDWTGVYVDISGSYLSLIHKLSVVDDSQDCARFKFYEEKEAKRPSAIGLSLRYMSHGERKVAGASLGIRFSRSEIDWTVRTGEGSKTPEPYQAALKDRGCSNSDSEVSFTSSWEFIPRVRLGAPIGKRVLLYVAGGGLLNRDREVKFTHYMSGMSASTAGAGDAVDMTTYTLTSVEAEWSYGGLLGFGVEVALTRSISISGEYLYMGYLPQRIERSESDEAPALDKRVFGSYDSAVSGHVLSVSLSGRF